MLNDVRFQAADVLKAETTPEAFVLDGGFVLRYRGRIDNGYYARLRKNANVTEHDLKDALDAVLDGKDVPHPATQPVGRAHHMAVGQDVPVGRDDDAAAGAMHLRHPAAPPGLRGPPGHAHADDGRTNGLNRLDDGLGVGVQCLYLRVRLGKRALIGVNHNLTSAVLSRVTPPGPQGIPRPRTPGGRPRAPRT